MAEAHRKKLQALGFNEEWERTAVFYVRQVKNSKIKDHEIRAIQADCLSGDRIYLLEYKDKRGNEVNKVCLSFTALLKALKETIKVLEKQ